MYSKEYYINLLKSSFMLQIDIPNSFLSDNDIQQFIYSYKWSIIKQDCVTGWTTISKSVTVYD